MVRWARFLSLGVASGAWLHGESGPGGDVTFVSILPARALPAHTKAIAARDTLERRFGNAFATGDFNEDGRLDVVADIHGPDPDNRDNAVRVYVQEPNGQFIERIEQRLPTVGWTFAYLTGDFNQDRHLDILMDDLGSSDLVLLLGQGDGTFLEPVVLGLGASGFFASADFNADQRLDLTAGNLDGTVGVFLGDGQGAFTPKATLDTFVIPSLPPRGEILTGDLNTDGREDIVVCSVGSLSADVGNLDVFLGNGDGTFQEVVRTDQIAARRGVLGYFDNDHFLDFAGTRTWPSPAVEVWFGDGDGRFRWNRSYPLTYSNVWMVRAADLNYDGISDLFVTGDSLTPLNLFLGNADGTFQSSQFFTPGHGYEIGVTAPEFVDLNGDGLGDMIGLALKPTSPLEEALAVALSQGIKEDPSRGFLIGWWTRPWDDRPRVLVKSTNLVDWTPLATNRYRLRFHDPASNVPLGFYRVREP